MIITYSLIFVWIIFFCTFQLRNLRKGDATKERLSQIVLEVVFLNKFTIFLDELDLCHEFSVID